MFDAGYIYSIMLIILAVFGGVCGTISYFRSPKPPPGANKKEVERYYKEMPLFGTKKPSPWQLDEIEAPEEQKRHNMAVCRDLEFYEAQLEQLTQLQNRAEREHQKRPSEVSYRKMITLDKQIFNTIKKIDTLRDSLD